MSEKFTKGDWIVSDQREIEGMKYAYSIHDEDGWYIAHIENCNMEEQEENAYLIAAAPKMYWMLDEVKEELEMISANPNVSEQIKASTWLSALHIEAVLKKARGEQ